MAAGLAVATITALLAGPLLNRPGAQVATLAYTSGEIRVKDNWLGGWRIIGVGDALAAGESLKTGPGGRASLLLVSGVSARLDGDTRIKLKGTERLKIKRGALYVDTSRAAAGAAGFEVVTKAGSVRHFGTQCELRLTGSRVSLRVREGRVEWRNGKGASTGGAAGEQLVIGQDGVVRRGAAQGFGASWDWVAAAAPAIDIDGLTLAAVLNWAGGELGRDIVFTDDGIESEADRIIVHGSIGGLTPMEALEVVLATTRFQAVAVDSRIVVGPQGPGLQPSVTNSSANPTI
jgi:hypothetical protein